MNVEKLAGLVGKFVVVAGEHISSQIEDEPDHERIDHVWITVNAAGFGRVRISLNTCSRKNLNAGHDPRISVATLTASWKTLPLGGIRESAPFDYRTFEAESAVAYVAMECDAIATMLLDKARRAVLIEAWGELYNRGHLGLHQLHSRRASAVIRTEHVGRDGGIRFYFATGIAETLLFKFWGQN